MSEVKRFVLYRSNKDRKLGGVCGGIAESLNVDSTVIRILWILFALAYGSGILVYFICWLIIPEKPFQPPAPSPTPIVQPSTLHIICPNCGREVSAGSKFCPNCGATIPEKL